MRDSQEDIQAQIDALQARLDELRELEDNQRKALRDATPIQWRYYIEPTRANLAFGEPVYDPSITFWRLWQKVVNPDEARAVGHNLDGDGKGMTYFYNTMSRRIVMSTGGGYIIISASSFWKQEREHADEIRQSAFQAMDELSTFINTHPQGGEVTDIIERHHKIKHPGA